MPISPIDSLRCRSHQTKQPRYLLLCSFHKSRMDFLRWWFRNTTEPSVHTKERRVEAAGLARPHQVCSSRLLIREKILIKNVLNLCAYNIWYILTRV
uniref:Uncharacterized protein n=1 Tax=Arundo donax TaxID=35708 RepID=A0A0A9DKH8_ARUDO